MRHYDTLLRLLHALLHEFYPHSSYNSICAAMLLVVALILLGNVLSGQKKREVSPGSVNDASRGPRADPRRAGAIIETEGE